MCSVARACLTLCDPTDCGLPGSSVHEILQARILEWVGISSSRGSSWLRDQTLTLMTLALAGVFFTSRTTWALPQFSSVQFSRSVVSDSFDPMDCSLPGSSVHEILQARILEWVAISFSKGYS